MAVAMTDTVRFFILAMRQRRKELGISQENLADKIGINAATVNQIENWRRIDPDMDSLEKIAFGLNSTFVLMIQRGRVIAMSEQEDLKAILAEKVFQYRSEFGLTYRDFCKHAGISLATLQSIEGQKKAATLDTLQKLAIALDVPAHILITPTKK
jgi:transcriptional regulator with XRE-family HTH domain